MRSIVHDVSRAELAILQALWELETATRRQITDLLYPGGDEAHYGTVQKLLERLENKGYVRHTRQGRGLLFTATIAREQLIQFRLRDVAQQLCDNSLTPLLMNLVQSRPLSAKEIDELRALLDELRRGAKSKKPRR
jgi:predicted transcriptional regulator